MSQIHKTTSSTPPPSTATSYVTNDGTAIPAVNILNVLGESTFECDDNGLFTQADPNNGNNLQIVLSNRMVVTATTVGATTATVDLFDCEDDESLSFRVLVTGFDSANNETTGGELVGAARDSGGTITVIGANDTNFESDAGLLAADWDVVDSSPNLAMEFTGVAGRTISWKALFEYIQTG